MPATPPVATGFAPMNLTPSLEEVGADIPAVYGDGCHHDTVATSVQNCSYGNKDGSFRVALFGDSHAAQWLPALQELAKSDSAIAIKAYTKSSCPAVDVTVLVKNLPYSSCDTWRNAVVKHLTSDPPDLVVISNFSAYPLDGFADSDARRSEWADGLRRMVTALRAAGSEVLVIADTPHFETSPAVCVSSHLTDVSACAGNRDTVLDAAQTAAESTATKAAGGRFVDLTPYICDSSSCPPIIRNLLVYRDVNHLTSTFAAYLSALLAEQVRPGGR
jgi:hypothetical protein